ncbi:hypothetical protein C0047_06805 [Pseudomonas aeruginosa]|nr:hypothetical protein C0047_06805 [Pseudomonas aeruginosa]
MSPPPGLVPPSLPPSPPGGLLPPSPPVPPSPPGGGPSPGPTSQPKAQEPLEVNQLPVNEPMTLQ